MQNPKDKELRYRGETQRPTMITYDNRGIIQSRKALLDISNKVSLILERRLDEISIREIVHMVQDISPDYYLNKPYNFMVDSLAKKFIDIQKQRISNTQQLNEPLYRDVQYNELMKTTTNEHPYKYGVHHDRIGREQPIGEYLDGELTEDPDVDKLIRQFLDPSNINDLFVSPHNQYIGFDNIALPHTIVPFDSRYRIMSYTVPNTIKWNLHSANKEGRIGDIRVIDTLQEVILIKICPFWIPLGSNKDGYYDKITMTIHEFSNQGAHFAEHRGVDEEDVFPINHHFEFDISRIDGNRIYLNPICDRFIPRKPIARIENITVSFRNPFQQVTILSDRGSFVVTVGNPTLFTGSVSHNLATGDLVYVLDYASVLATTNTEMNQAEGHFMTRINDLQFTIPVDTLALPSPDVTIIFGSKRIFFQLEFISLEH